MWRVAEIISAAGLLCCISSSTAAASQIVTRGAFIAAYVQCNNAAWKDVSHELIPLVRSGNRRVTGRDAPPINGFVAFGLYFGESDPTLHASQPATVGWAVALKSFSDNGGIASRFATRDASIAYLRAQGIAVAGLATREYESIATDVYVSRLSHPAVEPAGATVHDRSFTEPLTREAAERLLTTVGTHENVGRARIVPQRHARCPLEVRSRLFPH